MLANLFGFIAWFHFALSQLILRELFFVPPIHFFIAKSLRLAASAVVIQCISSVVLRIWIAIDGWPLLHALVSTFIFFSIVVIMKVVVPLTSCVQLHSTKCSMVWLLDTWNEHLEWFSSLCRLCELYDLASMVMLAIVPNIKLTKLTWPHHLIVIIHKRSIILPSHHLVPFAPFDHVNGPLMYPNSLRLDISIAFLKSSGPLLK